MSNFTKGPWTVERSEFGSIESARVFYPHGFLTSSNVIEVDDSRIEGESWLDMRNRTKGQRKANELESIANMYLISAAPDMYEALKAIASCNFNKISDGKIMITISQEDADNMINALNKADGKGE